ncbi:MAG TPA: glycosyl hydrolase 108 family protein [Bacillota bacterium]|uniref:glycoside hydrolase family 108 protein n=1 Tax=Acetomicrobium mobile TaxID=97477 RepID=UPI0026F01BE4|nr:glycosyl hydrolase 108 family protein [Acetomicrobium mobile]HOA36648.1 glycosyl hydrolase 108 family protein [Bacillota bacterium]
MTEEAELFILAAEGGYVDHPSDPGGATNYGITTATLKQARKQMTGLPEHVRDLTTEQALKIYDAFYWKPAGCDKLPSPIDLLVFDGAVNCGVRQGVKFLQEALNVINEDKDQLVTDGIIGKKTLAAVAEHSSSLRSLCAVVLWQRTLYYQSLTADKAAFRAFLRGWINRLARLWERCE